MNRIKELFRSDSKYRPLLLSILITGLGYGLYKGMLDNFLAEVVQMGEMDRGITEFFRELPDYCFRFHEISESDPLSHASPIPGPHANPITLEL